MQLNNLESLSFQQLKKNYPSINENEFLCENNEMDLFLIYALHDELDKLEEMVSIVDIMSLKNNIEKPIFLSKLMSYPLYSPYYSRVNLRKDKLMFPPMSEKVSGLHYLLFLNYYVNKYIVEDEVEINANNEKVIKIVEILLKKDKNFLKKEDENKNTIGDYLLVFLNELGIDIFEKYDIDFSSIKNTSKEYIDTIIKTTQYKDRAFNTDELKKINKKLCFTIQNEHYLNSLDYNKERKIKNFHDRLQSYYEKGVMENSIIKSNKKEKKLKY